MAVAQRLRVTCPRCASPVTGDFKYCPACACRLKQGVPEVVEAPARASPLAWLLGAGAVAVLGGLVAMGVVLFRDRADAPDGVRPPHPIESSADLTIATLPSYLRAVGEDVADWVTEEADGQVKTSQRWARPLKVLAFEVTRRLYAEYLASLTERVRGGQSPGETLRAIWNAETPAQRNYAQAYLMDWVEAFLVHAQERGLSREAAIEPLLQYMPEDQRVPDLRPNDIALRVRFPWPTDLGLLTAAPPTWAYVSPFGVLAVTLPEGTEQLPVTAVAWSDAIAFALWARGRLGGDLPLRLPVEGEWLRIAHGGHPPSPPDESRVGWDWPWGNEPLLRACNNRQYWPAGYPPRLQSVDWRYLDEGPDRDVHGDQTEDGIFGMAGNAREWCLSDQTLLVDQRLIVHWDERAKEEGGVAPTRGGSYLRGIYECTVTSRVPEPKTARRDDVGFRLVADALY